MGAGLFVSRVGLTFAREQVADGNVCLARQGNTDYRTCDQFCTSSGVHVAKSKTRSRNRKKLRSGDRTIGKKTDGRILARRAAQRHINNHGPATPLSDAYLQVDTKFERSLEIMTPQERAAAEHGWRMGFLASDFIGSDSRIGLVSDMASALRVQRNKQRKSGRRRKGKSVLADHDDLLRQLFATHTDQRNWLKLLLADLGKNGIHVGPDTVRTRLRGLELLPKNRK